MNSNWGRETLAVFQKEWLSEMRSRHGLYTSGLFSLLAVVAMSFASFGTKPPPSLAAGMLCVTLLFSAVVALPRSFLVEDEQGTFDLLRTAADSSAVFTGKLLYNSFQMLLSSLILTVLFVNLTGITVTAPLLLVLGLVCNALSLSAGVSVCGALVMGAANRWLLGTVAALPVLLPQVFLGVGTLQVSFGSGQAATGWKYLIGLFGWAVVFCSAGPLLAAAAWKSDE